MNGIRFSDGLISSIMSLRRPRIKVQPKVGRRSGVTNGQGQTGGSEPVANANEVERNTETAEATDTESKGDFTSINDESLDCQKLDKDVGQGNVEKLDGASDATSSPNPVPTPASAPAPVGRRGRIKPRVRLPTAKSVSTKSTNVQSVKENLDKEEIGVFAEKPCSPASPAEDTSEKPQLNATQEELTYPKKDALSIPVIEILSSKDVEDDVDAPSTSPTADQKSLLSPTTGRPVLKRGWLPKAKPNVVNADKRRARLSSFSENEDHMPPKKQKLSQPSTNAAVNSASEEDIGSKMADVADKMKGSCTDEKPVKPKVRQSKRRKVVKLDDDTLVSENRNKFTISDLIRMNPCSGRRSKKDLDKAEIKKEPGAEISRPSTPCLQQNDTTTTATTTTPDQPDEDDDIKAVGECEEEKETVDTMAPQVMIGPDGNIILNDASLVIDNPAAKADKTITEGDIVVENENYDPSFYYKKKSRCRTWSLKETCKFYVALSTIGTDFSLMTELFPKRSRVDLKRKFKVEERKHKELIDRALTERRELDMSLFEMSSEEEAEEAAGDENSPTGDIKQAVQQELQKESKAKKEGRKNRKMKENTTSKSKEKKSQENKKTPKKTIKGKRKKGRKSRYFADSETETEPEPQESTNKSQDKRLETEEATVDINESSDEECILEKVVSKKTRVGRQPKAPKQFQADSAPQKRPRKKSVEALSHLMPLVNLSPGATTKGVIEDEVTGQRLLLVKSPPPVGMTTPSKNTPSEFVHVYLLSPNVPLQANNEDSSHRPRSGSSPEGIQKMKIIGDTVTMVDKESSPVPIVPESKDKECTSGPIQHVLFSPEGQTKPIPNQSESAHGEDMTGHTNSPSSACTASNELVDKPGCVIQLKSPPQLTRRDQICAQSSSSHDPSINVSKGDVPNLPDINQVTHSFSYSKNSDKISNDKEENKTDASIEKEDSTNTKDPMTEDSKPSVVKTFDNSLITTITTSDGNIVEILIEPNMMEGFTDEDNSDNDGYSILNIEMPNSDVEIVKTEND